MPTKIYSSENSLMELAWLCDSNWNIPDQLIELEAWIGSNKLNMAPGAYIADIGFSPRKGARGGGASISPSFMKAMAELGISLWLSEYPE